VNKGENKILKGFSVANILNVVDALNLENSDYSVFELDGESIYSIKNMLYVRRRYNQSILLNSRVMKFQYSYQKNLEN
jgi:hypothetical protein